MREEGGCRRDDVGGEIEEVGWGRGGVGGRGYEGGGWSRIKYYIARMEYVEHNTTIEHNVMNEDDI